MNRNLKTFIAIGVIFSVSFVCLVLLMLILSLRGMSESENIGEDYRIVDTSSGDILVVDNKHRSKYDDNDSVTIQKYKYDDDFAILFGWRSPQAIKQIEQDSIYRDFEQTLELFKKENKPFFMIIDKRNDSIYYPLTLSEYIETRQKLGVSDELQLKLRL